MDLSECKATQKAVRTISHYTALQQGIQGKLVFWPQSKEQIRSSWGIQTGLAGAIFLLCISCVESYLKNFQLTIFFSPSGKFQFMKINKFHGNMLVFKIKYFHCSEEQKANGDDKVKECSDISFQACQL